MLLAGVALNMYGLSMEAYNEGVVAKFLRSLSMSLEMFVYNNNLFEMTAAQRKPLFIEAYMLVFYAAILTSTSAIILLFGKRAMSHLVLFFRRKKFRHVFIGVNNLSSVSALVGDSDELSDTLLVNLAKGEHLRYSRYLTSRGYSYAPEDDDVFKTSHQICSWEDLTAEDHRYHMDMARAMVSICHSGLDPESQRQ